MKLFPIAVFAIAAGLFLSPPGHSSRPQVPTIAAPSPQASAVMDHDKMMADMKAADGRLGALTRPSIADHPCSLGGR